MAEKLTTREIVYTALVWAEESMLQMIAGCQGNDYGKEVAEKLKQLRAYRTRRYGKRPDPFKDCVAVDVRDLMK